MRHPEVLLVPVLMFLDYFLTVLGAVKREKGYSRHFRTEHYELNPIWQKDIARSRWFNPRHVAMVVLVAGGLVGLSQFAEISDEVLQALLGYFVILFGAIVGKHLSNLMTFGRLARRPDDISGQVTMKHQMVLSMSLYQSMGIAIPFVLAAFFRRRLSCWAVSAGSSPL